MATIEMLLIEVYGLVYKYTTMNLTTVFWHLRDCSFTSIEL